MAATQTKTGGLSDVEKAAARERVKELRAEAKRGADRDAGLKDVLDKISEMPEPDKSVARRIHAIVTETAPELAPRTFYGMPAYAKDGKIVCFFKPASKFKERYSTFGFDAGANLDEDHMWPTSYGLTQLTSTDEKQIAELVKKAVS